MATESFESVCQQFAYALHGKSSVENGVCSVSFKRDFEVKVQGKRSTSVLGVNATFEDLDQHGYALNIAELAILEEEIPPFMFASVQQGLIVSALHNHWLYTEPTIMYIHLQSLEPPVQFAQKLAYAFTKLRKYPTPLDKK